MKRILTLTFFALICLCACTKKKITIIEGNVLEFGTDKPIAGAKVPILIGYLTGPIQGDYVAIDTAFTDASGHFKWESDKDIKKDWYAFGKITADKYFRLNWKASGDYFTSIDFGDHYNQTMHLDPFAYLQLHVEDVPEVEGSYVRFGGTMFNNYSIELYGESYENTLLATGNRSDKTQLNFTFLEGPNITKSDSLLIPAHDTLFYHLKY